MQSVLAKRFPADGLVAGFAVFAAEPAAFVAQKFCLVLQRLRQCAQLFKGPVQPEIRHDEAERFALQLLPELGKAGQHLCRRRDKVESRIGSAQIVQQQVGMDDHAVLWPAGFREQAAERIAGWIGQMGLRQKGIAERQPGGKAVFLRQRQNRARVLLAAAHASAAPNAALRRAINRGDFAPIIKIFPVRPVERQKDAVKLIKFKQAGQMQLRTFRFGHVVVL